MPPRKKTVLVVDDELSYCFFLRLVLERAGYHVAEAHDGLQALGVLDLQRIDVVVTDLLMPKMNGHELAQELREDTELPIVLMSSLEERQVPADTMATVSRFLRKPFSSSTLLAAIDHALSLSPALATDHLPRHRRPPRPHPRQAA